MGMWDGKVKVYEGIGTTTEYEENYFVRGYVAKDGSGRTLTYEPGGYLEDDRGNVVRDPNY